MPLLPTDSESVAIKISQERKTKKMNNLGENGAGIRKYPKSEADEMQLPAERLGSSLTLLGMPNMDVSGQKSCAMCEFVLHELQKEMTQSSTEVRYFKIIKFKHLIN